MKLPYVPKGFTLVELIIVIVVIAILATIGVISYNGIQANARDTKIRAAAEHVQDALEIYIAQNGRRPRGGWGSTSGLSGGDCANGADGWFAKSTYTCTPEEVLVAANLISSNLISGLPPNKIIGNSSVYVFMLYGCTATSIALMWYLEKPSAADTASYDNSVGIKCPNQNFRTNYGMQAATVIDF